MSDRSCDFADDRAVWVLGALRGSHAADFAAHLSTCGACQAEVEWMGEAAELLLDVGSGPKVPARVEADLMSVVGHEAAILRMASTPDAASAPSRRTWLARAAAGVATAAILVGAGIGAGFALDRPGDRGARSVAPEPLLVGETSAQAVLQRSASGALLGLSQLDPPARGRVYQVWLRRAGRPLASTNRLFSVSRGGQALVALPALDGVEEIVITAEPRTGSTSPTLPAAAVVTRAAGRPF